MKTIVTILLLTLSVAAIGQTKVQGIEIETECKTFDIYVIYQGDIWIKHNKTPLEYEWGWEYNREINFKAKKGQELRTAFVTKSDTTYFSIMGNVNGKEIVQGGVLALNGGTTKLGYK